MVRPCAKYARLDCYAPLQVTAKTFAVTWSGLFTYAKLVTIWAWYRDMQDKIFLPKLLRTENIRRQNAVGIFRLVSYTHLGTFGLGSGTNRRRLIPIREARYFFELGLGTCKTKYFYRNCCAPKTSDGKTPSEFFGLSHTRTSVLLGLVPGRIGGGLFTCAKLATFFGLGLGTCKIKHFD